MKTKLIMFMAGLMLTAGCTSTLQKLPAITAESFDYKRYDPVGGTTIHADKIITDPKTGSVSADAVTWDVTYPSAGVHIAVKGYKQVGGEAPAPK